MEYNYVYWSLDFENGIVGVVVKLQMYILDFQQEEKSKVNN